MSNDHVVGFGLGVVVTAGAFYWYDRNRERIHEYLQAHEAGLASGLPMSPWAVEGRKPSLEDLMAQKERLEDMIAEAMAADRKLEPVSDKPV